jgi:ketosteroid isomerase-like protein
MPVSLQTVEQIEAHIRDFESMYASRDISRMAAFLHPDLTGFGTLAGEEFKKRSEFLDLLGKTFSRSTSGSLTITVSALHADGVIAWASARCRITLITNGSEVVKNYRMTLVFRGTGHAWTLAHLHLSEPAVQLSGNG